MLDPKLDLDWLLQADGMFLPNALVLRVKGGGEDMAAHAVGLFLVGSMFNHSCNPNTAYVANVDRAAPRLAFTAARAVSKGTELCIAYHGPHPHLRQILKNQYGFDCKCERCALGRAM